MATIANPGFLARPRSAWRKSCRKLCIGPLQTGIREPAGFCSPKSQVEARRATRPQRAVKTESLFGDLLSATIAVLQLLHRAPISFWDRNTGRCCGKLCPREFSSFPDVARFY